MARNRTGDVYGKVLTRFWEDGDIRALSHEDQRILLYLFTNKHRTIAGCYRLPLAYAMEDLGLERGPIVEAFTTSLTPWMIWDPDTQEVWVKNLAAVNMDWSRVEPFPTPDPNRKRKEDNRIPALTKAMGVVASPMLCRLWSEWYRSWGIKVPSFPVPERRGSPLQAPSEVLPTPSEANSSSSSNTSSNSNPQQPREETALERTLFSRLPLTGGSRWTVTEFLESLPPSQNRVSWVGRLNGYLDGNDLPGRKPVSPEAVVTACRDWDAVSNNWSPAFFRKCVLRAQSDLEAVRAPPSKSGTTRDARTLGVAQRFAEGEHG
jgi:hypothetical protein